MTLATQVNGDNAQLVIYDVIGFDWWSGGVVAADVVNWLAELGDDVKSIDVLLNSPGGSLTEGSAIYNALNRSPQKIVMHVDGMAASAASLIAMAGDEIRMSESALMMVHNASALTIGTADDHDDTASFLRKASGAMATIYSRRSGKDVAAVQTMMDEETWMTASEAVDEGFATDVVEGKSPESEGDADSDAAANWSEGGQRLVASFGRTPARLQAKQNPTLQIAASAKGTGPMNKETRIKLCLALDLPEDAKDETILIAAAAAKEPTSALIELIAEPAAPDLTKWVPKAEFDILAAGLAALEATDHASKVDAALAKHKSKVQSPEYEAVLRSQLESKALSFEAFDALMKSAPESRLTQEDDVTGAAELAADRATMAGLDMEEHELAYCKKSGMDPAAFVAKRDKRAKSRTLQLIG